MKINKYYVGVSENPETRLKYHIKGKSGSKSAFTKRADDWKIAFTKKFKTKSGALNAEKQIKRMKSKNYIQKIIRKDIDPR